MDWQKLVSTILEELDWAGEANSCIMAASVLIRVLQLKGLEGAYPLTVKPRIFNPRFTVRLEKEPVPSTPEIMKEWTSDGCAMVAIGHGQGSSEQWPAHLVVVIPKALKGKDAICDLTIIQAEKPEWGIQLEPILVGVRETFINGSQDFGVTINGSRIIYRAFPDDTSFKQTPIWKNKSWRDEIAKRVLKRL
jgi:hypothetical protein